MEINLIPQEEKEEKKNWFITIKVLLISFLVLSSILAFWVSGNL